MCRAPNAHHGVTLTKRSNHSTPRAFGILFHNAGLSGPDDDRTTPSAVHLPRNGRSHPPNRRQDCRTDHLPDHLWNRLPHHLPDDLQPLKRKIRTNVSNDYKKCHNSREHRKEHKNEPDESTRKRVAVQGYVSQ